MVLGKIGDECVSEPVERIIATNRLVSLPSRRMKVMRNILHYLRRL